MSLFLSYILVGMVAGTLAGLFGVGGGLIIVPVLIACFELQQFAPDTLTHLAIGTSLATIVITSLSSVKAHHDKQAVNWLLVKWLTLGIIIGSILGVFFAASLSGDKLQLVFGVFALLVGLKMAVNWSPGQQREKTNKPLLSGGGGVIGFLSAIFGIGGGTMTVPFLTWQGVPVKQSIGTSAACGLPIAIAGACTYIVVGWGNPALPDLAVGYVYLPALLGIILTSVIFAKLGAWLAHRLPSNYVRQLFALLLCAVGGHMMFF
ncbi:sulfite exporter TauE/SafE family protein [Spartinivicinus poritis]|uniref:Probable membrane transporter protein n=1 Tax=Spartinivicinus poritis TaxID=2994640 RepID=A0ABT5U4U1_9GAMM|nr:sulfite exporter TauE/SafE family protein [Spartinivicinus sp. A2-2]MDE1461381.1 sulfite exporter TauE/SafE family protein [Spartinivicinus sp. A2-2]